MTILLEVAAVGGACAVLKFVGPFLYNECFASDDDSWSEAGLHNSPPSERSPLLGVPGVASPRSSPRPNSLHLAAQLYSAHLEDRQRRASNSADSSVAVTPAATYSGLSTPSVSPSTPISTTSSYFDLRQPPLYVTDVQTALEKESKRRASNDFPKANLNAGFALSSAVPSGAVTPGSPPKMGQLTMVRRSSTPGNIGRPKPLTSDDALSSSASSQLVASLVCLLHARDMHDYFLTGKHIDEDIEDKQHRAVIDAFAATAQYFWPSGRYQSSPHLDLSVFHSLFKKSSSRLSSSPFPPSPYSSTSTLNGLPSSDSGAHTVSQLLHALHVALNEGENYTDQPTYLKAPFRVRSKSISSQASGKVVESDPQEEEGIRRHIDFLRNVNLIQEDSIVKDVFEGLCSVRVACAGCDEATVTFESFLVLDLPQPTTPRHRITLSSLLKAFERPVCSADSVQYCHRCRSHQAHVVTRKIWSLPNVLVFQLPSMAPSFSASSSTLVSGPGSSPASVKSSPALSFRRLPSARSRSYSTTSMMFDVEYPVEALNMSRYHPDRQRPTSPSDDLPGIPSVTECEYDLSSESGDDDSCSESANTSRTKEDDGADLYDLFAVRERVPGGNRCRAYAKDPEMGVWKMFGEPAAKGGNNSVVVRELSEVVTPNADLLFYHRRRV